MLRDEGVDVVPTWAQNEAWCGSETRGGDAKRFREIDRQLRAIAKQRAGLDASEARWLREAEQHRIWRKLGFSTALEYLEDVFGYAPRTAIDRLRVAKELGELPELEAELRDGTIPYSAVRELSRVVTRQTEAAWIARARGKNLRDIEELVAGHKKGDDPDAPKDPSLIKRKLVVELSPRVEALLQQCRGVAADELGSHVEDVELLELLCSRFLAGPAPASNKPTRPAHRIVVHRCDDCGRGWQEGRGRLVPLRASDLALAECDAEVVTAGRANEREDSAPEAVHSSGPVPKEIPRRIRKLVWSRDQGRCCVPGCRATRNLHIHHVIHRADGGDHDPAFLTLLCSGHHQLHHDGLLAITGRAPDQLTFVRDGKPLVDPRSSGELAEAQTLRVETKRSRFDDVVKIEQAKQALIQLGYKARTARQALDDIRCQVRANATVATLVQAVLAQGRNRDRYAAGEDVSILARQALVQLGYPSSIATPAVEAACAHVGTRAELQTVIKEALRRCMD